MAGSASSCYTYLLTPRCAHTSSRTHGHAGREPHTYSTSDVADPIGRHSTSARVCGPACEPYAHIRSRRSAPAMPQSRRRTSQLTGSTGWCPPPTPRAQHYLCDRTTQRAGVPLVAGSYIVVTGALPMPGHGASADPTAEWPAGCPAPHYSKASSPARECLL